MTPSLAQSLDYRLAGCETRLRADGTGELGFELDNISFFKDNEFEGEQAKGYSLPGLWLQPRLTYQPLEHLRLEAGFHALVFDGANKYPCYAYHDIGRWKGNQYQRGAHVLPFFRAQAQIGKVTFVLGDIYGTANHGLPDALWNPELALTQDPEMGFQMLAELPRWRMDTWINWQSYIFEEDTHQEAFTVGVAQRILLSKYAESLHWYMPVDVLVQHRGGEQDVTDMGVQTIVNGSAGVGLTWEARRRHLTRIEAEARWLGCWQQSGTLWPFDTGMAGTLSVAADFRNDFRVFCGAFMSQKFVSLYGAPFYSTLSQKHAGARFSYLVTPHIGGEWCHTFAPGYALGAKVEVFPLAAGKLTYADGHTDAATFANNFSFGIYMRCNPRFLLKRFSR